MNRARNRFSPLYRHVLAGLPAILAATAAVAASETTVNRTIVDANQDNRLEFAPGEPHRVRSDLAAPQAGRAERRVARLGFTQFSDTHIIDEESPLRVEFLGQLGPPVNGAYRPQEGLSPHVMNEMIRRVRRAVSPVTGKRAQLLMMTGDNSDNTQLNEVRWVIDLLDSGRIAPNSGKPNTCGTGPADHLYDGVRDAGVYYEPDGSSPAGEGIDGDGYAPLLAENQSEAGRSNRMRDYPGLYEAMNKPFDAPGLGLPWYAVFGNHDALLQGNQPRNEALEKLAVGCIKVTRLSTEALTQLQALLAGGLTPEETAAALLI